MDLTTPEGVVAYMSESTSEDDWGRRADEVIAANGGEYPKFWFEKIIVSGLPDKLFGSGSSDIHVEPL